MREKTFENRIIEAVRKRGAYATHIDCYTPGFPDVYIMEKGNVIQVEVKVADLDSRLCDIFEASQPVFYSEAKKRGVSFFVAIYLEDRKSVRVYSSIQMLAAYVDDRTAKIKSVAPIIDGDMQSAVDFILS